MPEKVQSSTTRRYSSPRGSVVQYFAKAARISPAHAAQLLSGHGNLRDRILKLIDSYHAARRQDLLETWFQPIDEARHRCPTVALTPELELEAQRAESRAGEERTRFFLHPRAEREARIRALKRELRDLQAIHDALLAEEAR